MEYFSINDWVVFICALIGGAFAVNGPGGFSAFCIGALVGLILILIFKLFTVAFIILREESRKIKQEHESEKARIVLEEIAVKDENLENSEESQLNIGTIIIIVGIAVAIFIFYNK